jgi:hypothetical protein
MCVWMWYTVSRNHTSSFELGPFRDAVQFSLVMLGGNTEHSSQWGKGSVSERARTSCRSGIVDALATSNMEQSRCVHTLWGDRGRPAWRSRKLRVYKNMDCSQVSLVRMPRALNTRLRGLDLIPQGTGAPGRCWAWIHLMGWHSKLKSPGVAWRRGGTEVAERWANRPAQWLCFSVINACLVFVSVNVTDIHPDLWYQTWGQSRTSWFIVLVHLNVLANTNR